MSNAGRPRFHLAFPVRDLGEARAFYKGVLGCAEGRSSDHWVDFDMMGHQIVAHLAHEDRAHEAASEVDGHAVPLRHFGMILDWADWEALRDRLLTADTDFVIAPHVRFPGKAGEQATMFLRDPSGNALEFKAFRDETQIFATD